MLTFLRADCVDFMGLKGSHKINLDLDTGLYFLTGRNLDHPRLGANACGKSTIFNLVYWALTGDLLDLVKPADEVVPWTATKRKVLGVLWFQIDDQYYGLKRARGPNGLWLKKGREGEWQECDQAKVRELIGLSNESLKRTIILGQFSDLFLDLQPKEQSQFFSEILNLDVWLAAAKTAGEERTKAYADRAKLQQSLDQLDGSATTTEEQLRHAEEDRSDWAKAQAGRIEDADEEVHQATLDLSGAESIFKTAVNPGDVSVVLGDLQAKARQAKGMLDTADADLDTITRKRERSDEKLAELSKQRKELLTAKDEGICPECGQAVDDAHLKTKLVALDAQIATTKAEKPSAQSAQDQLAKVRRLLATSQAVDAEIAPKLRHHTTATAAYSELKGRVGDAQRKVDGAKRRLADLKAQANPHATTEDRLAKKLDELGAERARLAEALLDTTADMEAGDLLETYFKEIRLSLIDEVLAELQVTIGAAAEQLGLEGWRITFSTERELKSGGTSVALTVMLYPPGVTKGINWKVYSGGERQRWQLAVTFGLSEVLLGRAGLESNLEVLDEPSRGTSAEGIEDLIEYLYQRARTQQKAIILVDHHILDRGLFDKTMVMVRENGESRLEAA